MKMSQNNVLLDDVFGLNEHENVLSYVQRDEVDLKLKSALRSRAKTAIVVYGASKQGKTSLCREALRDIPHINISCTRRISTETIYREMLSAAGAKVFDGDKVEFTATGGSSISSGFFSLGAKIGRAKTTTTKTIQVDWAFPKTVARTLSEIMPRCVVIVDNFHYLEPSTQKQLATDIRTFGAAGIKFLVLGTWKNRNQLQNYLVDLKGRTADISIEPWSEEHLMELIEKGEKALNIKLAKRIKTSFVKRCEGNVGLLQTFLREFLDSERVLERQKKQITVERYDKADTAVRGICRDLQDQVVNDFGLLATKIGDPWLDRKTRMSWIIDTILESPGKEISEGIPYKTLFRAVNKKLAKAKSRKELTSTDFGKLTKYTMLDFQQTHMATPFVAYDASSDCIILLDAWTRFVLKMEREIVRQRVKAYAGRMTA